jgi:hypothetical protein
MANQGGDLGDADCPFPVDPSVVWPHGLSALESSDPNGPVRVGFVSHRLVNDVLTDSIQLFDLYDDDENPLRWRGCLNFPADVIGNDIATRFSLDPWLTRESVSTGVVSVNPVTECIRFDCPGKVPRTFRESGWRMKRLGEPADSYQTS